MNSGPASGGWWIEVIPAEDAKFANDEYVWAVTPPYHFANVRCLDTSYGTRAEDSVKDSPSDFNFALDHEQFHRAEDLLNLAAYSRLLNDPQNALAALESSSVGKGRLSDSGLASGSLGWTRWPSARLNG